MFHVPPGMIVQQLVLVLDVQNKKSLSFKYFAFACNLGNSEQPKFEASNMPKMKTLSK